jgi:hypothetical protein
VIGGFENELAGVWGDEEWRILKKLEKTDGILEEIGSLKLMHSLNVFSKLLEFQDSTQISS